MNAPQIATALLLCAGIGHTQGLPVSQHPFLDRSDTGVTVHVLPTPASIRPALGAQPTEAPVTHLTAVFAPSYGSGKLINHGGPIIAHTGFVAIYWNSSVALSTATSLGYTTIQDQIRAFINAFPKNADWDNDPTDDYEIIQQYHGSNGMPANTLHDFGSFVGSRVTRSGITDSEIQDYLSLVFSKGLFAGPNLVYGVYFPSGMQISLDGASCSTFCAYHSHFTYKDVQIKYAVFPYPDCAACSVSGKTVADILTIVSSHEIRESVTDPGDNNSGAWFDILGYEADDKCAWHNLYQMTNGGFWVQ